MDLDDELCLCFHVSKRKVINFIRTQRLQRASQISECSGAGTGCGWCRPFLAQLLAEASTGSSTELPTREDYAAQRARYRDQKAGKPPANSQPEHRDD